MRNSKFFIKINFLFGLVLLLNSHISVFGQDNIQYVSFASENEPINAVISPDDSHLYLLQANSITVYDRNKTSGELSFNNRYVESTDTDVKLSKCTDIAISPDGNNIYITSLAYNSISMWERNSSTGALTFSETHATLGSSDTPLSSPNTIEISSNGKFVFVGGHKEISAWTRNTNTGKLQFSAETNLGDNYTLVHDLLIFNNNTQLKVASTSTWFGTFNVNATTGKPSDAGKLNVVNDWSNKMYSVISTKDEAHLYLAVKSDSWIALIINNKRNAFYQRDSITKNPNGGVFTDYLNVPTQIILSSDDKVLYVANQGDSTISAWTRNSNNGTLTFLEQYKNGTNNISGMSSTFKLVMSNDDLYMYSLEQGDNALVTWKRNTTNGKLTFVNKVKADPTAIRGLTPIETISSSNGKNIYMLGKELTADNYLTIWSRDVTNGELSYKGYGINNSLTYYPKSIAIHPEKNHLYVLDLINNGIMTFAIDHEAIKVSRIDSTLMLNGKEYMTKKSSLLYSPEKDVLYAAGSGTLCVWKWDDQGDSLSLIQSVDQTSGNSNGLETVTMVATTSVGNHLYLGSEKSGTISFWKRDPQTGMMSFVELYENEAEDVLDGFSHLLVNAVAPHLYTYNESSQTLGVWSRDEVTGKLTYANKFQDFQNVDDVMLSADGQFLYTHSSESKTLSVWTINKSTGMPSSEEEYTEDQVPGLWGSVGFIPVNNSQQLYLLGEKTLSTLTSPAVVKTQEIVNNRPHLNVKVVLQGNNLILELPETEISTPIDFHIFDLNGKFQTSKRILPYSGKTTWDLNGTNLTGVYFLQISIGKSVTNIKKISIL